MRKLILIPLLPALVLFPVLAAAKMVSFDSDKMGAIPKGWTAYMTHSGNAPKWEILNDSTAPSKPYVLGQTSSGESDNRFPLLIYDDSSLKDGEVSVAFKPMSGRIDQGAGLVWRYKDPDNYYIARANGLEDNVVLYKVEKGVRIPLAPKGDPANTYGVRHRVPNYVWSNLRVTFNGPLFTVYMGKDKVFDVEDTTFTDTGKVGLWTKSDSVMSFDNFEFKDSSAKD